MGWQSRSMCRAGPRTVATAIAAAVWLEAHASTVMEETFICPLGGEAFQSLVEVSGYRKGTYLDLKSFGALASPSLLPVCPGNGFVMYKDEFSPPELARLGEYVRSDEYQGLRNEHTSYYLASRLQRALGASIDKIAAALLKATWQAQSSGQYRRYAAEALDAYQSIPLGHYDDVERWLRDQLVAGELERRLARFDAAGARFERLAAMPEVVTGFQRQIVELQLHLVAAKNSGREKVPRGR